ALLFLAVLGGSGWLLYESGALRIEGLPAPGTDAALAPPSAAAPPSEPVAAPPPVPAPPPAVPPAPPPTAPPATAPAAAPATAPAAAAPAAPATAPAGAAAEDNAPPEERAEPVAPVPAVPVDESRIDPPARPAPAAAPAPRPVAKTLAQVKGLIGAGHTDEAIAGLQHLRRESPRNAYLWYLLGSLYFDKGFWSDGLETYRAAIHFGGGYARRPVLIRNAIRALGSDKTQHKAAALLKADIGGPALPLLRQAARADKDPKVRARAAKLLKPATPPTRPKPAAPKKRHR
ncbi:MAG TPA: hypothetical protein VGQ83_41085, partial [Polyangia bacterium]